MNNFEKNLISYFKKNNLITGNYESKFYLKIFKIKNNYYFTNCYGVLKLNNNNRNINNLKNLKLKNIKIIEKSKNNTLTEKYGEAYLLGCKVY